MQHSGTCRSALMTFHAIQFDQHGHPLVPEGVDAEEWRLDLPSILGMAHAGCLDSDKEEASLEDWVDEFEVLEDGGIMGCSVRMCEEGAANTSTEPVTMSSCAASPIAVMPHIDLDVSYKHASTCQTDAWNVRDETHVYVLEAPPLPVTVAPVHPAELFSMRMLHRGHLRMGDFATLLELLDGACSIKKRKCIDSGVGSGHRASFAVGAYTLGGLGGLLKQTRVFPWTVRLLVAVVRGCCYNHRFNAVALHRNTFMAPHTDSQNERGCSNLVLPCSRWLGGGIWAAEDSHLSTVQDTSVQGRIHAVCFPYVLLDPHVLHGTQLWTGDRIILVAYAARDMGLLCDEDISLLADFGFTVRYGSN